ncbi:MAG: hypothetical protein OJF51_002488 [Nitrospira sp.]|nr:MAG: hypothetical protein OJF51_002488 [Nitrospira sp.]
MAAALPEEWAPVGAAEPVKGATESASAVGPEKVVRAPEVGLEPAVEEWVAGARDQRLRP